MDVHLLGPVEVTLDGRSLPLGAAKQRAVLAMLALRPNVVVPLERLVEGLWDEEPPASAAKMVQLYVSQLRRLLAGEEAEIVTRGRGYELRLPDDAVDAVRFERLVACAGEDSADGVAREALRLWRGPALADLADEPFAAAEIRRLDELRLRASELAIERDLAEGRHAEALADIDRLVGEHPLRETLQAQRMLALYRSGRQADALDAYAAARRRLVDGIGIEPGARLRELHQRILRQDPSLLPAPRPAAAAGPRATNGGPPGGLRQRSEPARPQSRRRLVVAAAAAALLLGTGVFAFSRLTAPDRVARIEAGGVGVIDTRAGAISAQYRLGSEPASVVAGGGSVWVASPRDGTVSRIRAGGDRVEVLDAGRAPVAMAFGRRALWVASDESGEIARVRLDTDRVAQRIRVGNGLQSVALGAGGLWAVTALDGEVVRIDPTTGRVTRRSAVGGHPVALAVGAGAVWATAEEAGAVVRIDPRSADAVDSIAVGNGPSAVTVAFGAVWVANQQDGTVSRIDPGTDTVTDTVPAGRKPVALAVAGGALWVADAGGAVLKLDPRRRAVVARVRTGSSPVGLAAVGGALWTSAAAPPAAHRGGTLRMGEAGDTSEMDPAAVGYAGPNYRVALAYEGLVAFRRASGTGGARLVGALALDVPKATDGGRRYVFRLRPGLRYWDGTPVRAADIRFALERTLTVNGRDVPPLIEAIDGAAGCRARAKPCSLARGVVGDERTHTVTLHLRRADPGLLENLATPVFALVAPGTPRRPRDGLAPVGTGPYRVERIVPHRSVTLGRNPYYRAPDREHQAPGLVDRIEVSMGDPHALVEEVAAGRLDLTSVAPSDLPPAQWTALQDRLGPRLLSGPRPTTWYAFLNTRRPPFDDVRVRRAVNLAVDRARLVEAAGGSDAASPTCQLIPPGMPGYRPICPFTASPSSAGAWRAPDITKAERLVAAAGARGKPVKLWTWQSFAPQAREFARALRRVGFRARLRLMDSDAGNAELPEDPRNWPQVGLLGWGADTTESAAMLRRLISCRSFDPRAPERGTNWSGFCDPSLDAAIERVAAARPADASAWARIERRIARAAPLVPLYTDRTLLASSSRTGNVEISPFRWVMLDRVWVR